MGHVNAGGDHLAFLLQQGDGAGVVLLLVQCPACPFMLQHTVILYPLWAGQCDLALLHNIILALCWPIPVTTVTVALLRENTDTAH